jgi:hypothetical protein
MIYGYVLLSPERLVIRSIEEPCFVHLCRIEQMPGEGNELRLVLERVPSDECPRSLGLLLTCRRT